MRILVISKVPTHPTTTGSRSYLKSICATLNSQGHAVEFLHVVTYTRHPKYRWCLQRPQPSAEMVASWGTAMHTYRTTIRDTGADWGSEPLRRPRLALHGAPAGLASAVSSLVGSGAFDAVVVNYWNLMASVEQLSGVRRILVTNEVFANRTAAESGWMKTDEQTEDKALGAADVILAIQDNEAEELKARTRTPVVTTYHYSKVARLPLGDTANLLFLGSVNPQNVEGLRYFLKRIFPEIKSRFSDLRLVIGGPICHAVPDASLVEGVVLQGVVDSAADFYAQGNMCISPNLQGGGLKTKVLEALAHGRTVLASPYTLRDIPWADSAPLIACSDARQYIDAIGARLSDRELLVREQELAIAYAHTTNAHFRQAISAMTSW